MSEREFIQDPTYADHFGAYRKILDRLLNHDPAMFSLPQGARIVDVGCGYGELLMLLQSRGYTDLIGVEPDPVCRQGAIERGLDARDGTLQTTGLPNAFADAIIVNMVFHHIDDYASAVTELSRILKPGGFLCIMEPAPTLLRRLMDFLTFKTPLPKLLPPVRTRFEVMKLEIETGLYPKFLAEQKQFLSALDGRFTKLWLKRAWLFQFGKFRLRAN